MPPLLASMLVRTSDQETSGKDIFRVLKQIVLVNFGDTGFT
jgi:hypothetical protein